MEQPPKNPIEEIRFSAEEQALIARVKEAFPDPDLLEALRAWSAGLEQEADKTNSMQGRINVALRQAKLYYEAGFASEAIESLGAVLDQLYGAQNEILFDQIKEIQQKWQQENKA